MSAIEATRRKILTTLSRWRGALPAEELPLFRDFVRATLPKVRGPFLAQHPPKEVIDALAVAFSHCLVHKGDDPKVDMRKRSSRGMIVLCSMPDQPRSPSETTGEGESGRLGWAAARGGSRPRDADSAARGSSSSGGVVWYAAAECDVKHACGRGALGR